MASVIVLAAGFGSRLRPLTDELPKPLVPVGDRSILEHTISRLEQAGFAEVVINAHHLAAVFAPYLARVTARAVIVKEPVLRGTAGGVAGARRHFRDGPVLVWNGDILARPPIELLLEAAGPEHFCLAVAPRVGIDGTIGLDARGNVARLRGERFGEEVSSGDYIGVLALGRGSIAALPSSGCLFGEGALPRLRAGGVVTTVRAVEPWSDVGNPLSLLLANLDWLRARGLDSFVAPSAQVATGVQLRASVIGAGATLVGCGTVERCVVCPGAHVVAPLADAIVAPSGRMMNVHA